MFRPLVCDRARAQIALGFDGELSQLENAMLRAHVTRCAECRAFGESLAPIVAGLRAAPLEEPSSPISVGRWRTARLRSAERAVARVGIAATVVIGVLGVAMSVDDPELRQSEALRQKHRLFTTLWSPDVEQSQVARQKRWRVGERHGGLFTV